MSVSVEEQIRLLGRAFEHYVGNVEVDEVIGSARTSSDDAGDSPEVHDTEAVRTGHRKPVRHSTHPHTTRRPRRRATLAAAAFVLVVGIVAMVIVAQRPVDAPSGPPTPVPAPDWYAALAPLLPDGFEHVAIQQSYQSYVQFEAFNIESSKSLHITVSRSAMRADTSGLTMSLAEAQAEPWTDPSLEYDISLPGGRQVGLSCHFRPMPDKESACPDLNGDRTDPEMLRAFALALSTELSPDDLPPRTSELDHVAASTIRAAIGDRYTTPENFELEAPHNSFAFVQHGDMVKDAGFFTVRTVSGFYPPLPANTERTSATFNGHRLTWQPIGDTIWYVFDNPSRGADVADEILDRAVDASSVIRTIAPPGINNGDLEHPADSAIGALVAPELPDGFELMHTTDTPVPFAVAIDPDDNRLEIAVASGSTALREVDRVEDDLRHEVPEGRLAVGPDGKLDEHAAYLVTDDAIITVTYARVQEPGSIEPGSAVRIARTIARTLPPELITGRDVRIGTALLHDLEAELGSLFDPVTASDRSIQVQGAATIEVSGDVTSEGATVRADVRIELFHAQVAPAFIEQMAVDDALSRDIRRVGRWLVIATVHAAGDPPPLPATDIADLVASRLEDGGYIDLTTG